MSETEQLERLLENFANSVIEYAFSLPPPNEVTPVLVQMAQVVTHRLKVIRARKIHNTQPTREFVDGPTPNEAAWSASGMTGRRLP